jgi:hypothetical protein
MADFLKLIGEYAWLSYFIGLCLFLFLALKQVKVNSSLIALTAAAAVGWVMDHYRDILLAVNDETLKTIVRYAWYMGFASLDAMIIFAIYKVHVVFKKTYSMITKIILFSFFVKGLLHLTRLTERQFFTTDVLKPIYSWGIVSINVTTTIMILTVALVAVQQHYSGKKLKGKLWQI